MNTFLLLAAVSSVAATARVTAAAETGEDAAITFATVRALADDAAREHFEEFRKMAGLSEAEAAFVPTANQDLIPRLSAALETDTPPDVVRLYESYVQLYRKQGHMMDVTDLVQKMQAEEGGLFDSSLTAVAYDGRYWGVPFAINPWPMHVRMDVLDSYISDIKAVSLDSQAIAGYNGAGPFRIINNYLEAAGENIMFGGADPAVTNLVPTGIEIRRNHLYKPLSWRQEILTRPATLTATGGASGSLGSGTHYFKVVALMYTATVTAVSTPSVEVHASVGSSGSVTLKWAGVAGADQDPVEREHRAVQRLHQREDRPQVVGLLEHRRVSREDPRNQVREREHQRRKAEAEVDRHHDHACTGCVRAVRVAGAERPPDDHLPGDRDRVRDSLLAGCGRETPVLLRGADRGGRPHPGLQPDSEPAFNRSHASPRSPDVTIRGPCVAHDEDSWGDLDVCHAVLAAHGVVCRLCLRSCESSVASWPGRKSRLVNNVQRLAPGGVESSSSLIVLAHSVTRASRSSMLMAPYS